uniref:Glycerophosphocholine acyltransferase 1 n=1 Tax=Caenorhabditis tropicalis TaxID=1561998 RepID=A0A1I7V0Y2_9PELO
MNRADGAEQSKEALQADYKPPDKNKQLDEVLTQTPYRKYLYKKFDGSKEIMAIAYKAKAMVIMRFVYIGCFVHMLCAYPVYDRVEIHSSREIFSFSWYYVLLVLIAQASMTFFKWYDATWLFFFFL